VYRCKHLHWQERPNTSPKKKWTSCHACPVSHSKKTKNKKTKTHLLCSSLCEHVCRVRVVIDTSFFFWGLSGKESEHAGLLKIHQNYVETNL
jgi:hypothetical protein